MVASYCIKQKIYKYAEKNLFFVRSSNDFSDWKVNYDFQATANYGQRRRNGLQGYVSIEDHFGWGSDPEDLRISRAHSNPTFPSSEWTFSWYPLTMVRSMNRLLITTIAFSTFPSVTCRHKHKTGVRQSPQLVQNLLLHLNLKELFNGIK